jgi:hypothetical protein
VLLLLRRRAILGHRGLHKRLERARVDRLPFVDVDRPSRVAFQAGIEEARWVWDAGPPGERELTTFLYAYRPKGDPLDALVACMRWLGSATVRDK